MNQRTCSKLIAAILALTLAGCGNAETLESTAAPEIKKAQLVETIEATTVPVTTVVPTEAPVERLHCGDVIENEVFRMSIHNIEFKDGPEYLLDPGNDSVAISMIVETGYKAIILSGHIENLGENKINDNSFVKKITVNGEYIVEGSDVNLFFVRNKYYEMDGYTDKDFVIYATIPEKLVGNLESIEYSLGCNADMGQIPTRMVNGVVVEPETDYSYIVEYIPGNEAVHTR